MGSPGSGRRPPPRGRLPRHRDHRPGRGQDQRRPVAGDARRSTRTRARSICAVTSRARSTRWNQLDEPRVRCSTSTAWCAPSRRAVIEYLGTESGEVFTAEALARLDPPVCRAVLRRRRRASASTLRWTARRRSPRSWMERSAGCPTTALRVGRCGARAAFQQDVRVPIVSPAGRGEVWTPSYRWSAEPAAARAAVRRPGSGPAAGDVQRRGDGRATDLSLTRRSADSSPSALPASAAPLSDWVTSWLRWEGGTAFDRIGPIPRVALEGSLNARAFGDRLAVIALGRPLVRLRRPRVRSARGERSPPRGRPRHEMCRSSPHWSASPGPPTRAAGGVAGGEQSAEEPGRLSARASAAQRQHHHRRGLRPAAGLLHHRVPVSVPHPLSGCWRWPGSSTPHRPRAGSTRNASPLPRRRRHRRARERPSAAGTSGWTSAMACVTAGCGSAAGLRSRPGGHDDATDHCWLCRAAAAGPGRRFRCRPGASRKPRGRRREVPRARADGGGGGLPKHCERHVALHQKIEAGLPSAP